MRRAIIIVGLLALAAAGWWGYSAYRARQSAAGAPPAEAPTEDLENVIWASGTLVPVRWASLGPAIGGVIRTIEVAEGDQVEADALLVELDNTILKSQVEVAAAAVAEAEAARDQLLAGATPAAIEGARADLAAAEANVAVAEAQITQAREAVAAAEAGLQRAQEGPDEGQIISARVDLANAESALEQAQAAYDQVKWRNDIAALPEALALEQATNNHAAAKARLDELMKGPNAADIAAAQARVREARAAVSAAEANVQAAQAQAARARAALDALLAGATAEEQAMAGARVQSARAALAAAEAQLVQTQVKAPFAGQVGSVLARPGELAAPNQPVLVLGDTAAMHVETTDLRETDVTRLRVGMPVEVTFDALPGEIFQGTITRIAPMSRIEQGSTTYTVAVDVAELDPSLRWGMTAFVNIRAE